MRVWYAGSIPLLVLTLEGCSSQWSSEDLDGDGFSVAQGDCWDNPEEDPGGGLTARDIFPGKGNETWYDGIDENCDGADDYDQDGDGHASAEYSEAEGGGDDCWDDPTRIPEGFDAVSGYYQPLAADVHPGADELWYDGVDSDCGGDSDFDQDGDGFDSAWHVPAGGTAGPDCFDADDDPFDNPAALDPEDVNPDADETWYDGTDANCDGADDYDQDGDGYTLAEECDDTDASVYPNNNAEIWYDGIDQNCDGKSDYDQDGDGYDSALYGGDDCNDDPAAFADAINGFPDLPADEMYPGALDIPYDGIDADCAGDSDFDADGDGQNSDAWPDTEAVYGTDCDDGDGSIYFGATEVWYDGVDSDCSGGSDYDQDGDGYDSADYGAGTHDDCDDARADVNPGVEEDCGDPADNDCDGDTNDVGALGCTEHYRDADGDGYGDLADSLCICEPEGTYDVTDASLADCDDDDAAVNPGVPVEDCATAADDDCDGDTDAVDADNCTDFYADGDGDGAGAGTPECRCEPTAAYSSTTGDDCDDAEAGVYPGAAELCDFIDQDCDGDIDEGATHYYTDADLDGFGDDATESCTAGTGSVTVPGDCDDADERVYPGAPELCDEQQNDCDLSSWSSVDEEGIVSFIDGTDAWSDATAAFSGGSAGAADIVTLSEGSYAICPGTWYIGVTVTSGAVTVEAPYGSTDTILDLDGYGASVASVTNAELTLVGLTLTGGTGTTSGSTSYGGGGFAFATTSTSTSTLTLEDCEVTANTATYGAGVTSYSYGDVVMVGTQVYGNTAATSGGGIYIQKGEVSCDSGGVHDNVATSSEGGGAWFGYQQGGLESTDCDWTNNSPDDVAGTGSGFATEPDSSYGANASFSCRGYTGCTP